MKWSDRELSRLRMILETERSHSVHEMAKNAQRIIKKRSLNAIIHKLNELISQEEFTEDFIELDGEVFPAQVISGYIIITLPDGSYAPAHHKVPPEWDIARDSGSILVSTGKRVMERISDIQRNHPDRYTKYILGLLEDATRFYRNLWGLKFLPLGVAFC